MPSLPPACWGCGCDVGNGQRAATRTEAPPNTRWVAPGVVRDGPAVMEQLWALAWTHHDRAALGSCRFAQECQQGGDILQAPLILSEWGPGLNSVCIQDLREKHVREHQQGESRMGAPSRFRGGCEKRPSHLPSTEGDLGLGSGRPQLRAWSATASAWTSHVTPLTCVLVAKWTRGSLADSFMWLRGPGGRVRAEVAGRHRVPRVCGVRLSHCLPAALLLPYPVTLGNLSEHQFLHLQSGNASICLVGLWRLMCENTVSRASWAPSPPFLLLVGEGDGRTWCVRVVLCLLWLGGQPTRSPTSVA